MSTETPVIERIRHPIKARLLHVKSISNPSPDMRRITLTGEDLHGFVSSSFDDHVKLLVPEQAGQIPAMPVTGEKGLEFPEGQQAPAMRDYTPRRYDPVNNELEIDFVLHHDGPATSWATHAKIGDPLGIAGPRGSMVITRDFDWHLLIGDETAIPAIGRRLEELPANSRAIVVIKTCREHARIEFAHQCELDIRWVTEASPPVDGPGALESSVRQLSLPAGEGFAWAAGEHKEIRAVRKYLTEGLQLPNNRIRAASYWHRTPEDLNDDSTDHEQ